MEKDMNQEKEVANEILYRNGSTECRFTAFRL